MLCLYEIQNILNIHSNYNNQNVILNIPHTELKIITTWTNVIKGGHKSLRY